jgi:hypothetical protein
MNARCKGAHDPENSKAQRARAGFIDLHPPEPEARKTFAWRDARSHRQASIRTREETACAAVQGSRESERMSLPNVQLISRSERSGRPAPKCKTPEVRERLSVPDAQLLGLALLTLRAACGWRSPSGRFTEREGCFPSHVRCCQTHWQVSLRMFKPEGLVSCSPGVPSESECSPGNPVSRPIPVRSRTPSGFRPSDQPCGRASSSTRL